MNTKLILIYVLMVFCIISGVIMVRIELSHANANVLNWLVVGLIFWGAISCWRKAGKLSE